MLIEAKKNYSEKVINNSNEEKLKALEILLQTLEQYDFLKVTKFELFPSTITLHVYRKTTICIKSFTEVIHHNYYSMQVNF